MKKIFSKLKNPKFVRGLLAVLGVILVVAGLIYWQKVKDRVFIDNSLVDVPLISVSPQTAGKLKEVDVYENQNVKKGDNLAVVGSETLRADNDGLIVTVNRQIGSQFNSQTPVIQMVNKSDMRIAGTIDENKGLSDIRVGQVASFTVDALPGQIFWGYIDEISPSAKQTQISFSISSERPIQQFVVYARFPADKYPQIKSGMSAKMTVYTATR